MNKLSTFASIVFAGALAATPALSLTFEGEAKTADECIDRYVTLEAYDMAFSGGGELNIEGEELRALIEDCEQSTDTNVDLYKEIGAIKYSVEPF